MSPFIMIVFKRQIYKTENRPFISRNGTGKGLTTRGVGKMVRGLLEFGCDYTPPCILHNL